MQTFFVTSAERREGKTLVALALVRAIRRRGHRAIGMKPVDTACPPGPDHDLLSVDGRYLQTASGPPDVPYTIVAPYRLGSPLPPGLALAEAGLDLSLSELAQTVREAAAFADVLIVEGPWSHTAPLVNDAVTLDLAKALESQLIVCVANGDEALSRASAVYAAAKLRGLDVRGVVLSALDLASTDGIERRAGELGERLLGVTVLPLPWLSGDLEARVTAVEALLEPWVRSLYGALRPS